MKKHLTIKFSDGSTLEKITRGCINKLRKRYPIGHFMSVGYGKKGFRKIVSHNIKSV